MEKLKIKAMLSDIIAEIDYDIWKERFNEETVQEPDKIDYNYKYLIDIVEEHLENNIGE
ncbi:hypothetical protein LCGC14_0825160 [marine sediment metagenome]|uniref:Uncharacterized protein n=1 Tax=marine sediment metagenome TaxID=412755 RepID=A0A0F9S2H6_9ZZZZ